MDTLGNISRNPLDPEEFRRQGHMIVDFLADYYGDIEYYPVRSQVEPGYLSKRLPESAPYSSESIETILKDINVPITLLIFPLPPPLQATELESVVMNWLGQMLNLPKSFLFTSELGSSGGGVLQGTTCEALLCTLVAARDQMLRKFGRDNISKLVVYASDQTHCALQKGAKIAGIHPNNFPVIATSKATEFALSRDSLLTAILADIEAGLVPLYLCATVGTTSSTAVDPVGPLCKVAKKYGIWVHVDAAYAGSAYIELFPYHDRLAVSQPRNPPRVEFAHGSIEFRKTTTNLDTAPMIFPSLHKTIIVNYSVESINKLKVMVNDNPDRRYNTFVCFLSHVWKKVTQVRGLGLEESSQVRIAVNGRTRISEPVVPMEYFGNLLLWAYPILKVRELLNESHAYIAQVILNEVNRVNDRYFKSFIDFGAGVYEAEELQETTSEPGSTLCPNLEVDSWLGFPVHDIDFGSGSPCAIIPPNSPFEGIVVFILADGGVDVKLTLFAKHVSLFKKISHSIDGKLSCSSL
ncbi:hypothetical protein C5167_036852 [Papaver somniferum]|uniref:tyrosine decarboxylase n=1 Tax=Papaver somniferum TaxID=3469 RepID=A0A4Y7I886_PAPSO|nr:hypothetical protein C5167_036852 [Papaver somniferum]